MESQLNLVMLPLLLEYVDRRQCGYRKLHRGIGSLWTYCFRELLLRVSIPAVESKRVQGGLMNVRWD